MSDSSQPARAAGPLPVGYARRIPAGFVALGIGFVLGQAAIQVVFAGLASLLTFGGALSVGLAVLFALPVVLVGLWLSRRDLSPERYPRVAGWCLGLLAVLLVINLAMIAAWTTGSFYQDLAWAVQGAAMGAAGGAVFGSIEARSIERAREAERAAVRTEQLEAQREWLEYLNSLLRHEVLNTANVIVGYADLLLADHEGDDATRERLERISRQSRKMTDVIQDVRLLIQATNEAADLEPIDLTELLDREVTALEDRFEDVSVETDWPEDVAVRADEILSRVFSNLLANAVEHNDAESPHVSVSVAVDGDAVTVRVADDGPGIPDAELDSLFERTGRGDHGLGLYLVHTLLDRYDGTIELEETGPDGTTFVVELPRATGQPEATEPAEPPRIDAV